MNTHIISMTDITTLISNSQVDVMANTYTKSAWNKKVSKKKQVQIELKIVIVIGYNRCVWEQSEHCE